MPINILLIEDSEIDVELTLRALQKSDLDFEFSNVEKLAELEVELKSNDFDVIISDYNLADFTGEEAFLLVRKLRPNIPFIIQSGTVSKEMEVNLLKNNVTDVVLKRNVDRLPFSVKRALREKKEQDELRDNIKTQNALAKISVLFDSDISIDEKINSTLKIIGETAAPSRVYVYKDYNGGAKTRNTHEWVAPGEISQKEKITELNYEKDLPGWKSLLSRDKSLSVSDTKKLPDSFKRALQLQDIKSMLVCPILSSREQVGFIGLSDTKQFREWPGYVKEMLMTVSGFISNALREQQYIQSLQEANLNLKNALDEKNVLIGEIHHRVKNNLALISSFIELKRFDTEHDEVYKVLTANILKIKHIARIQELLYKTESFSNVPIYPVIQELTELMRDESSGNLDFVLDESDQDIMLNINQATPFILLLSVLLLITITERKEDFVREEEALVQLSLRLDKNRFTFEIENSAICRFFEEIESLDSISIEAQVLAKQVKAELNLITGTNILSISFDKKDLKGSSSSL